MKLSTQLGLVLTSFSLAASSYAADFYVTDSAEFRTALEGAALNGEADTIHLASGTYKTTDDGGGTFKFADLETHDLSIIGDNRDGVIVDGDDTHDVLNITFDSSGAKLHLENLTISNGLRGLYLHNIESIITNAHIKRNNLVEGAGAGIYTDSNMQIIDSFITNNTLTPGSQYNQQNGAGVHSTNSTSLSIINSEISNNTINPNTNTSSSTDAQGAGIYHQGASSKRSDLYISGSTISNNAISTANSGDGIGAGLRAVKDTQGTLYTEIRNSIISGNSINSGGDALGAGIYDNGDIKIYDSEISDNAVSSYTRWKNGEGAGIFTNRTLVERTKFLRNIAKTHGGGINTVWHLEISNSIFVGNSSEEGDGSAISQRGLYGKLAVSNNLFANNSGSNTVYINSDRAPKNLIVNSTFDNNSGTDIVATGDLNIRYNYLNSGNVEAVAVYQKGNIASGDLAFESGSYLPSSNSVLVDAGLIDEVLFNLPSKDIRGYSRVFNGSVDIGPYEFGATATDPVINTVDVSGNLKVGSELTFNIDAQAIDTRNITGYEIDYGYGRFNTVESLSTYTYETPGSYTVIIRVSDNEGESTEYSFDQVIIDRSLEEKLLIAKEEGKNEGINAVLDNPANYNLVTASQNVSNIADATESGKRYVLNHLGEFNLITEIQNGSNIADALELGKQYVLDHLGEFELLTSTQNNLNIADAEELGKQHVLNNLLEFALTTLSNLEIKIAEALEAGKQYTQDNLSEFGLADVSALDITEQRINNLEAGWHLLPVYSPINELSIFDNATIIWGHKGNTYKAYSNSEPLREKIVAAGYELLTEIPSGTGIWVSKE